MKNVLLLIICSVLAVSPAWAEKPVKAEKMKPAISEKAQHKSERSKEHLDDADRELKEMRKEKEMKEAAGLEKQRETKTEEAMKELGKGSEQGQKAREENRKKWWKFWE